MAIEIGILLGIMISAMQKTNLQWQMINLTLTCKEKCTFRVDEYESTTDGKTYDIITS